MLEAIIHFLSYATPIIVALITGVIAINIKSKQEIKIAELNLYFTERNKAYQAFINGLPLMTNCFYQQGDNFIQFVTLYSSAYLLATDETRDKLEKLYSVIRERQHHLISGGMGGFHTVEKSFLDVCVSMRGELCYPEQKLKKYF